MLWGGHDTCSLELRRAANGATRLRGSFPYNKRAVLSDGGRNGGRPRKEVIAPRAFSYRVDDPAADIHLLVGHSYDRPLASRAAGTLTLTDTEAALIFEATITPELRDVSWVKDILAAISAGLIVGISPGFRLPPPRAVAKAEEITEEQDEGPGSENRGAIIRTILAALLYELSLVTVPAYPETQVEARNWSPSAAPDLRNPPDATLRRALNRWRA